MKGGIIKLLKGAPIGQALHSLEKFLSPEAIEQVAEHLVNNGVLLPPVMPGETVYAEITDFDDSNFIEPYKVYGMAYFKGKWYVLDSDGGLNEVGSEYCRLTIEEAERHLNLIKQEEE